MSEPLLRVVNLTVEINDHTILDDVSFEVAEDKTLAIIGPNGAGKTILFKALLGLIPYKGEIIWQKGIKIGYVPQKLYIEPDLPLTTEEFLSLKENDKGKITKLLNLIGFGDSQDHKKHISQHILKRKIGVLSGGEQQRVFIALALLGNPDVLLFDEPTTGIDLSGEETIYSLLKRLQEKQNLTIMLISHELELVSKYADKVICLNKEKVCFGPPSQALDKESLSKLFGEDFAIYKHHDK